MMLVRYNGVKKHIPKGMLAKNDSQEKMWGLSSVLNKAVQFVPWTAPLERGQIFLLIFYAPISLTPNRSSVL